MPHFDTLDELLELVSSKPPLTVQELIGLWSGHARHPWTELPELYLGVGKKLLSVGEILLAHQVFSQGLETLFPQQEALVRPGQRAPDFPDPEDRDPALLREGTQKLYARLIQNLALALAQAGATRRAREILERLVEREILDGETEGILGRTFKDEAFDVSSSDPSRSPGRSNLFAAYRSYFDGWRRADRQRVSGPSKRRDSFVPACRYNGINAATCAWFIGETETARALASSVIDLPDDGQDFAVPACIAEAHLILALTGSPAELERHLTSCSLEYARFVKAADKDFRAIRSAQLQVQRIFEHVARVPAGTADIPARSSLEAWYRQSTESRLFPLPKVLCHLAHSVEPARQCHKEYCLSAGHRNSVYEQVRDQFDKHLAHHDCLKVVATVSTPVEILFAEALLQRRDLLAVQGKGGIVSLHIVLPYEIERIKRLLDEYWTRRLDLVLKEASEVEILGDQQDTETSVAELRSFASLYAQGLARIHGDVFGVEADILETFSDEGMVCGHNVTRQVTPPTVSEVRLRRKGDESIHYSFLPLLYSDIAGYSKLDDRQLKVFSQTFPGLVEEVLNKAGDYFAPRRTQGDSILLGFKDIPTAIEVARQLRERVSATDWVALGFPQRLQMRIALDAGPCYGFDDPTSQVVDICGKYVNRAARIEPVTPPGEIYTSQTFAALARLALGRGCGVNLVGRRALPKGFGELVVYHIR